MFFCYSSYVCRFLRWSVGNPVEFLSQAASLLKQECRTFWETLKSERDPNLENCPCITKGPCTHIVRTWALKYLNRDYIKAKVYTI